MKELVLYPIAGKYRNDPVDVSIIVPLYKSRKEVQDQILRWLPEPSLSFETIYVDDRCPQKSTQAVFSTWNRRPDKQDYLVKLIVSPVNRGFGGACNLGAYHARGKHLIFLNADTTVTPNWISPMAKVLEDESVGIVGNIQLKEGGELHGTIDGAGSEWLWNQMNFLHIGRHVYDGKLLKRPYDFMEIPEDLLKLSEREMITGCCLGIRKSLFEEVGAFHIHYHKGYWEDSELCLSVRRLGYKIVCQPESIIFHKLAHSGNQDTDGNSLVFFNKWVNNGQLDHYVKDKRTIPHIKIGKVLIKRKAAHGDVLLAAAIAPAVKKQYPKAKVFFATSCPEVLDGNPHLSGVLDHVTTTAQFQIVIDLDYAYERVPFKNMLEAYATEALVDASDAELYIKQTPPSCDLPHNYVVVHASKNSWVGRNWCAKHFNAVARKIRHAGFSVVCIGCSGDHPVECDLDLRGQTTIHELASVMAGACLFVGVDSLPLHIAQAVNLPGVVFFGSIQPETRLIRKNMTFVVAKNCSCLGCHHRKLPPSVATTVCETQHLECEHVTVDQMWRRIKEKLCNKNA